ncbi:uncharacterized protein CANTADRAFT_24510 [Suhomyces tanzawaensis NRRL Y-17324]|uniref:Exocyst complex component Sec10-like alpha-helical bundle domain-containing protein n=1 Tax=Suhomyces tanzawaensis NRRL Y-17324 TaxID=984487 RepID=A0A1E4SQF7_9ASCO|nr:uncharacterized protein CANTADRAFT_24510 [Suhomyces tanzawaensis NRRL Y-17324]ODV81642.1 hypothetical protein CANTADRAFT_24510 [Suhomyces tanzawaensis NRRL Y-17324]
MAQVIWNTDIDVYNPDVIPVLVAKAIAGFLPIQDLLSFGQVSRNTYRTVSDPEVWVARLRAMKVWQTAQVPRDGHGRPLTPGEIHDLENPLICVNSVVKIPKLAQFQLLKIHKSLYPYYVDLLGNKSYDQLKIFKDFTTPEDQAKILNNLIMYNKIDYIDDSREVIRDKINALFEIFENALLRELEIHFDIQDYEVTKRFVKILIDLKNQQTLIDFFLQKSIFDNEESELFNPETFDASKFFEPVGWKESHVEDGIEKIQLDDSPVSEEDREYELNEPEFKRLIADLAAIFNQQAQVIDLIFPQSVPMMYKVCEELISNQVKELLMILIDASKLKNLYLTVVPTIYQLMTEDFIALLKPNENVGESYHQLVTELFDMLYESFVVEHMREEAVFFQANSKAHILEWKEDISKREAETTQNILKHVKVETKNDFLTSFKKVFTVNTNNSSGKNSEATDEKNYSEIQAKAQILSENIKSLNKTLSPSLVLETLNEARTSLQRLYRFKSFTIAALKDEIFTSMQGIFVHVLDTIGSEHIRPGFERALQYLQTYNPASPTYTESHNESFNEPIGLFFELINMADLIIQMIDIFYKEELINRNIFKHENSIFNTSLQNKKKLEALVDKYVADGLNVGIEVLVNEIDHVYKTNSVDADYNAAPNTALSIGPTEAAKKAVKILDDNIDLLVDSADKSIVEVFQQEIAERFFQIIVKTMKNNTISVTGATNLISDLNLYYDFMVAHIKSNKRMVLPLYQSLKKVGNIYLIGGTDSKAIGKLVSDLSKFNGIFGQEEIYEFVQRRQDWPQIRKHVEKVMYGFGLGDCTIV